MVALSKDEERKLEVVLGLVALDADFRARFLRNPRAVCDSVGLLTGRFGQLLAVEKPDDVLVIVVPPAIK